MIQFKEMDISSRQIRKSSGSGQSVENWYQVRLPDISEYMDFTEKPLMIKGVYRYADE